MLLVKCSDNGIVTEVDLNVERPVTIVNNTVGHVVGREIIIRSLPLAIPPAVGDAYLIPVCYGLEQHIECSCLDLVPDVLGEGGPALVVAVSAIQTEAIDAVPVGVVGVVACPEGYFLGVSAATSVDDVDEVDLLNGKS